jgi:RNA polymerase sigma factor (sigma-70 family)
MVIGRGGAARPRLQALFHFGAFGALTDGQLLERFATGRGESGELAFAVLVERHGPMVLRVCRAVLRDEHDAQDAFQATFLVLARRHRSLWVRDSLGPWLYGVARRVACSSRAAADRRRRQERKAAELVRARPAGAERDVELEESLHEEIGRLPERYRAPVVLCLVEGLSHEEAARHLGWPVGTLKSRLAGGRERLRSRLVRRGLTPGATLLAAPVARATRAAVPGSLVDATARAAVRAVTSRAALGAVTAALASSSDQLQRNGTMTKVLFATAAVLTLGTLGLATDPPEGRSVSGVEFTFVDLQPRGNHLRTVALGAIQGNDLAGVARGPQKLGGDWFKVGERLIRVRGQRSPEPPEAVEGIAINAKFDALHILHSTMFGNAFGVEDGAEIGAYVVRYADQTEERIPIIYGRDVRDWWMSSDPDVPSLGKVAWAGNNEAAGEDDEIRLFASEWKNPHPDRRVRAIDFETRNTACAPFLVALTLERALYETESSSAR